MPSRRANVVPKRLVFLGCEGKSEQGYGRWLNRTGNNIGVPIAIRAEALKGGDPLDLVEQAINKLTAIERRRGKYRIRGLLLDDDLLGQKISRDTKAHQLSEDFGIKLIWQLASHEEFLLRHFSETEQLRPADNSLAMTQLLRVWPGYQKGMDAIGYEKILNRTHVDRARRSIPELDQFLSAIGWPYEKPN